ncbi:TetR/AcrR family transcriptional regulator C-terminal domain-containing protein [Pseudonocardia sp. KRD291]|uniref:TetR/AcrR family transcriptional regulator C-terminal domain-containing protein n=1 Tax=Pseudonocardia sp. KRD291 TaxID=2792007 RepID=UPI001C4A124C|nr:TetR/AcrR family transcriptional regulator C-terminal domain-containing protein [Pseudonocardia sp. KRD291]MBW0106584.1 TetR/AcrR family transcriptional regulator C-terminal domain-containing protein [Pseudonocardia sp. KRD291]
MDEQYRAGGPASVRVADTLRERIRSGALAPGERVPSTREISREWGVAMATATKVLAALRADGLVQPVTGVGTVVRDGPAPGPPPGRAPAGAARTVRSRPHGTGPRTGATATGAGSETGLSTGLVVRTALAVADAEGLAALSMRRVAVELGVATMSLYRHVADKDDLLVRMLDAAFDEWVPPPPPPPGWRAGVEQVCHALWSGFRRHPWMASALSLTRPQALAGAMVYSDRILGGLAELGLSPTVAFDTQLILFNFTRGVAISLESEQQAEADTGRTADEWVDEHLPDTRAALGTRDLPALRHTLDRLVDGYDLDLDHLFTTGLAHLLDGIAARHT